MGKRPLFGSTSSKQRGLSWPQLTVVHIPSELQHLHAGTMACVIDAHVARIAEAQLRVYSVMSRVDKKFETDNSRGVPQTIS
jgi:hypothetical protein